MAITNEKLASALTHKLIKSAGGPTFNTSYALTGTPTVVGALGGAAAGAGLSSLLSYIKGRPARTSDTITSGILGGLAGGGLGYAYQRGGGNPITGVENMFGAAKDPTGTVVPGNTDLAPALVNAGTEANTSGLGPLAKPGVLTRIGEPVATTAAEYGGGQVVGRVGARIFKGKEGMALKPIQVSQRNWTKEQAKVNDANLKSNVAMNAAAQREHNARILWEESERQGLPKVQQDAYRRDFLEASKANTGRGLSLDTSGTPSKVVDDAKANFDRDILHGSVAERWGDRMGAAGVAAGLAARVYGYFHPSAVSVGTGGQQ